MHVHVVGAPITRQISIAHRTSEHSAVIRELLANLLDAAHGRADIGV